MDENALLDLLDNINSKKYIGVVSFEILTFAGENGLIERTDIGNFMLTEKGLYFLSKKTGVKRIKN
jgi:hypothetical protein